MTFPKSPRAPPSSAQPRPPRPLVATEVWGKRGGLSREPPPTLFLLPSESNPPPPLSSPPTSFSPPRARQMTRQGRWNMRGSPLIGPRGGTLCPDPSPLPLSLPPRPLLVFCGHRAGKISHLFNFQRQGQLRAQTLGPAPVSRTNLSFSQGALPDLPHGGGGRGEEMPWEPGPSFPQSLVSGPCRCRSMSMSMSGSSSRSSARSEPSAASERLRLICIRPQATGHRPSMSPVATRARHAISRMSSRSLDCSETKPPPRHPPHRSSPPALLPG